MHRNEISSRISGDDSDDDSVSTRYAPPSRGGGRGSGLIARGTSSRFGFGPHANSRKWQSKPQSEYDEYRVVRNAMQRIFPRSEVSKYSHNDYLKHKQDFLADRAAEMKERLALKEEEKDLELPPLAKPFNGKLPTNNVGPVMGYKTIWCPTWKQGKEEISPWPSYAEMKWEGDDRAKTNVARHLALPREEGIPSIHWQNIPVVKQYPLDKVHRVPDMEDTHAPVEEIRILDAFRLVQRSLIEYIDTFNIYLVHIRYLEDLAENDPVKYYHEMARYESPVYYIPPENDWGNQEKGQASQGQSRDARPRYPPSETKVRRSTVENVFASPETTSSSVHYSTPDNFSTRTDDPSAMGRIYSPFGTVGTTSTDYTRQTEHQYLEDKYYYS